MTTEQELKTFISNTKESQTLEYKLKPNFNEIKENFKEIQKRMHFNILKTIYAFANTEGGKLYIGITDQRAIEGIDKSDQNIVEKTILESVSVNSIIKTKKKCIPLENGRVVIEIKVHPLKIYEKPLFVNGILYFRDKDATNKVEQSLRDYPLYEDRQLYMYYEKGIESNLKKLLKEQRKSFELNQFINGLKSHIESVIAENKVTGYEEKLKEAENLLDQIRQKEVDPPLKEASPPLRPPDLDSLIRKFIEIYKQIIGLM